MPRLKGKKRGRGMVAVRSLQEPFDWFPGFHPGPPTSPLSSGCSLLSTISGGILQNRNQLCATPLSKPFSSSHLTWSKS